MAYVAICGLLACQQPCIGGGSGGVNILFNNGVFWRLFRRHVYSMVFSRRRYSIPLFYSYYSLLFSVCDYLMCEEELTEARRELFIVLFGILLLYYNKFVIQSNIVA